MEVSSRRLAIVQHRHPPARGLLSLISLLSAFSLTGINRNQYVMASKYFHRSDTILIGFDADCKTRSQ